MVTLDDVLKAHRGLEGRVRRTPLLSSTQFEQRVGVPVYLKLENWQRTGSFKVRGALTKVAALGPAERERGVVTASAGNHAQAMAYASTAEGVSCTVVMPAAAPAAKVEATRGYGANVVLEPDRMQLFTTLERIAEEQGATLVSPFDDPYVIAGQGTVSLEILEDLPEVGTIVAPIGGGGLLAGVAVAVKSQRPDVRIVGVEPEGAAAMYRSREAGRPMQLEEINTIADGLAAPFAGEITFPLIDQYVDDLVLVSDDEIRQAMFLLLERCKVLAEPAGAAALATLLTGKANVRPDAPAVAIVSGGNTDVANLSQLLAG